MEQTAVEWYEIEINSLIEKYEAKEISEREFITMKHNLFYKVKELEKKQQGYSEEEVLKKFMTEYKHLQQFYKTKEEFKQHLLSGEVKISIPDMINFLNK